MYMSSFIYIYIYMSSFFFDANLPYTCSFSASASSYHQTHRAMHRFTGRTAVAFAGRLGWTRSFSGGPSAEAIAAIQANFKKNPAQAGKIWRFLVDFYGLGEKTQLEHKMCM